MIDLTPLIKNILLFMPVIFIIAFLKSSWFKGKVGEFLVDLFGKIALSKDYTSFKDITLKHNNDITQIDEVIVSKYGVFVIEVKNMKGWIFGNEKDKYWTQKIYKKTYKFYNPIFQNYKHVKMLQSYLDLKENQIFPVISFVGECELKTSMPSYVTVGIDYLKYIKSKTRVVVDDNKLIEIKRKLQNLPSDANIKKEHIKFVKNKKIN